MMTQLKAVAILAFAAMAAAQSLDHPPLQDGSDDTSPGNEGVCPEHPYTLSAYDSGMIPEDCAHIASNEGLNPADFEITNVTYDDCADPWVFCRHKDHPVSIDDLARRFGKVPVGMRDYVKHVVGILGEGAAYNSGGNIAMHQDYGLNGPFNGWLHESAHSLDGQGAFDNLPAGTSFTTTQPWLDAYNADTNVPDTYSQSSQAENFAQMTVLSIYDQTEEGGIASIRPNWQGIQNQLAVVKDKAGARILPGGTCARVVQPSSPIPVGAASSRVMKFKPFNFSTK